MMRALAPLILVLPGAAAVFADGNRFLTAYNSTSESVSSSTSTCIANRPASCGAQIPWTGHCGLLEQNTDCWCGDYCYATFSSACCEDSPGAYAVMWVVIILVIIIIIAVIAAGVWCCCTGRCPCCRGQAAQMAIASDALRLATATASSSASASVPPFHRLKM